MIIFSAVLVAAAIGVLAAGAIDGNLAVVYLSIGLSVLAARCWRLEWCGSERQSSESLLRPPSRRVRAPMFPP